MFWLSDINEYVHIRTTDRTTTESSESLYEDDLNYDNLDPRQYTMDPTVGHTTFQPSMSTRPETTTIGPPNDLDDY